MKTIQFIIEYDLDAPHDWAVAGILDPDKGGMQPIPKGLYERLPYILATMLRDCVAPKEPADRSEVKEGP